VSAIQLADIYYKPIEIHNFTYNTLVLMMTI